MRQKNELVYLLPQKLVIHDAHPVKALTYEVKKRLVSVFYDKSLTKRTISKQALQTSIEINPIHIVGTHSHPLIVSGWARAFAAKLFNLEEEISCIHWKNISEEKIKELAYADFFIDSNIENHNQVANKIRSICMAETLGDPVLKDLLSMDFVSPRHHYRLPVTRKLNALMKELESEDEAVRSLIKEDFEKRVKTPVRNKEAAPVNFVGEQSKLFTDLTQEDL